MRITDYAFTADKFAHVDDMRACGCAACMAKIEQGSTYERGVIDTIPGTPNGETVTPGTPFIGYISPANDTDMIRLNVVAGESYLISLRGIGETPINDAFLVLYDDEGGLWDYDDDGGRGINSLLTFTAQYTGAYYISAESFSSPGQAAEAGQYSVDVRQMGEDEVSDAFSQATEIEVGSVTFGFIEPVAEDDLDIDTYQVTLEAGKFYNFFLSGGADYEFQDRDLFPGELDTILVLYNSETEYLTDNDDIEYPYDISSALGYYAQVSGTYYIDVFAYPEQWGGYTLEIEELDLSTLDPLDAIDWGTELENPNDIRVYFAPAGMSEGGVTSLGWTDYEISRAMAALEQYENIIDINVSITTDPTVATFRMYTLNSNQFLGRFGPPDTANAGRGEFSRTGTGWNATGGLEQGGYGFITLIHEFGHGFGLAHPHDNGGSSSIMPGVTGPFDSLGVFDMNQGVYTTMSYNDGWFRHPDARPDGFPVGASVNWGWQGTMMALDIALLQEKYGAVARNTGNNTYALDDANAKGTFYETIWDTGGTDTISYTGARDARIDLTAATLDYSATGAGVVSFVDGIYGGYTIANGVVIENATGGNGNDALIGNDAENVLTGNGGNDVLMGGGGADTINGGAGTDMASYLNASSGVSASLSTMRGSGGDAAGDRYTGIEQLEGSNFADTLTGGSYNDLIRGAGGDDDIIGGNGVDTLEGEDGEDMLDGGNGADILRGGAGNDTLRGGNDGDSLNGGAGDDTLSGGNGNDIFLFTETGGEDRITDFRRGQDSINLSSIDAVEGGGDNAFSWIGSAAFSGTAGQLRSYNSGAGNVLAGDVDGDGLADFMIMTGNVAIIQSDVVL